ncbi:hypothetical protein [Rhizobium leguminosarum]|uniref:hypothetical protein n=1 Tax=Rhizobium leguminosarum TaxID=384 RepID=UPI0013F14B1D|nr:hypothetical protein [Rhizobium leguminosarum]
MSLVSPIDRRHFRKAIETKDFVVGNFTRSRISNEPVLPLATPVLEGEVVTAVCG